MNQGLDKSDLVSMLWTLKRAFGRYPEQGVAFIHLNSLIKDADYRQDVLVRAADSGVPELEQLARQIQAILANEKAEDAEAAIAELQRKPARAAHEQTNAREKSSRRLLVAGAVGSLAALGGVGAFLLSGQSVSDLNVLGGANQVKGAITGQVTWKKGQEYELEEVVFVEAGARLTIEPGVLVRGKPGSALVVTRDATIHARGTAAEPIVFTSSAKPGQRARGDWGGVVMLGNAPLNKPRSQVEGIDVSDSRGAFGGSDVDSNCGLLDYVRIEFAGYELSANNELNALTLGGCGASTVIRHVQIHRAQDDGIEVFGGTVDFQKVVITGARDDAFDWDMGWRGRVQFMVAQQYADEGDNGFEGDNNKNEPDAQPRSLPQFYNVTLVSPSSTLKSQRAMTIRRGSGGQFRNMIITGFSSEAIDFRNRETVRLTETGELDFAGVAFSRIGAGGTGWFSAETGEGDDDEGFDEFAYFSQSARDVSFSPTPLLTLAAFSETAPNFVPDVDTRLESLAQLPLQGEFWDESANYAGAFRPGSQTSWMQGWTSFPAN